MPSVSSVTDDDQDPVLPRYVILIYGSCLRFTITKITVMKMSFPLFMILKLRFPRKSLPSDKGMCSCCCCILHYIICYMLYICIMYYMYMYIHIHIHISTN